MPYRIAAVSISDSASLAPISTLAQALSEAGHTVQLLAPRRAGLPESVRNPQSVPLDLDFAKGSEAEAMRAPLEAELDKFNPQLVVCDAFSLGALPTGDDGPLVINVPGMLALISGLWGEEPAPVDEAMRVHAPRALLASNSFFGLEDATLLPPCVCCTGPLVLAQDEDALDANLKKFLEGAPGEVCVVRGYDAPKGREPAATKVTLDALYKTIFYVLERTECHVVWVQETAHKWVTQQESELVHVVKKGSPALYAHPKVCAIIAHADFSTVLDATAAAKPVLALPLNLVQKATSQLLAGAGIAEAITSLVPDLDSNDAIDDGMPIVSTGAAATALSKLLTDKSYQQAATRLQKLALEAGGTTALVKRIEHAAANGVKHLHPPGDPLGARKEEKSSGLLSYWPLIALSLVVAFIAFLVRLLR